MNDATDTDHYSKDLYYCACIGGVFLKGTCTRSKYKTLNKLFMLSQIVKSELWARCRVMQIRGEDKESIDERLGNMTEGRMRWVR